jgi:Uma2 family endonuclease
MSTLLQTDPPLPARELLPTMYDLPSEEIGDAGMPDEFHVHQAILLDETFIPPTVGREEYFTAIDLNLYFKCAPPRLVQTPRLVRGAGGGAPVRRA